MKKIILFACTGLLLLVAIVIVKTLTGFPDRQAYPQSAIRLVSFDEAAAISRMSEALTYPTISWDDRSQFDEQAFIGFHRHLQNAFPLVHQHAVRTVINDYSLIFHLPGSREDLEPVLMMGHMDVVPVDPQTREQWHQDPFSGAVADNVIWGRGALDDKVSVMALMEAMEMLIASGNMPERSLYLAFGHDEEVGGKDGAKAIAAHFAEQNIRFAYVLDEGGVITDGLVGGVSQPVAIIGVAEKGFMNLRLSVEDPGGHSSQPPNHTAAGILAKAIVALENNQFPTDLRFSELTFNAIGHHANFATRLPMANLWLLSPLVTQVLLSDPNTAASIRTTTAATMLEGSTKSNILPTLATAVVNFRLMPGTASDDVVAHAHAVIDDPRVRIEAFMVNEASPVSDTEAEGYKLIEHTIRRMDSAVLVAPYLVRGGTDAKYFYPLSDQVYRFMMVTLNPETLTQFHGVNEQISVDDYLRAIQFYHAMLSQSAQATLMQ